MDTPKVSVIMPARNAEHWLLEAARSVLEQDYPDFELLIYDDHSTDKTFDVMAHLATEDARVRVFAGVGAPNCSTGRNVLTEASTGTIIMHSDADDRSLPGRIRRQVEHLLAGDLVFNCVRWTQSDGSQGRIFPENARDGLAIMAEGGKAFAGNSCAYRREVWEAGIKHDERWPWGHDMLFEAQIMERFWPRMAGLNEVWYWYRRHPGQVVQQRAAGTLNISADYYETRDAEMVKAIGELCRRELGRSAVFDKAAKP